MTAVSDFHQWRLEQLQRANELMRELSALLRRRAEREEEMIARALATGRPVWEYVDPAEDRRIAELRQTIADYRTVDLGWRTLHSLDDRGEPLQME